MIEIDIIEHCAANDAGIQGYYQQKVLRRHLRRRHHLSWTVTSQPHSMLCTVKDVALGTLFMGNLTLAPSIFMYAHTWPWGPVFGWGRGALDMGQQIFFIVLHQFYFWKCKPSSIVISVFMKYSRKIYYNALPDTFDIDDQHSSVSISLSKARTASSSSVRPTKNGVSKSEKWFCPKFENFTIFSSQVA